MVENRERLMNHTALSIQATPGIDRAFMVAHAATGDLLNGFIRFIFPQGSLPEGK
jgi:hypothetical protein